MIACPYDGIGRTCNIRQILEIIPSFYREQKMSLEMNVIMGSLSQIFAALLILLNLSYSSVVSVAERQPMTGHHKFTCIEILP